MQIFPTRMCNVTAWRHLRLRAYWLMALVGGGGGAAEGEVSMRSPGIAASPISLLFMGGVCGRSLNGGENSLHWNANMIPLFSIMTLWPKHIWM